MGNWMKVLQHSMSRHNMTNPNKPKLVNYNGKTVAMPYREFLCAKFW